MIILIMMAQVLFFDGFFEKDPHLNAVEYSVIFDFKIELSEQEIRFYEFSLSKKKNKNKKNFQAICSYILGLDK